MDHRLIEGLMEVIAPLIKEYVDGRLAKDVAPLRAELAEYKAREPQKGEPGKDADPELIKAAVLEALPKPENGKDVDPEVVRQMVVEEVSKIPAGAPGADADLATVFRMVEEEVSHAMAGIEVPKDGKDADPVAIAELVVAEVAKIERPKDGKDIDPEFVRSVITEEVAKIEVRDGKDGEPGPAGASVSADELLPMVEELVKGAVVSEMASVVIPVGKDGEPGKSVAVEDVLPVLEEMVTKRFDALPKPKDGVDGHDGKSVTVDEIAPLVDAVVAKKVDALPKMPTSLLIDGEGDLVAIYPDGPKPIGKVRGEDGVRGASVMDGEVDEDGSLVLRMSDGRIVRTSKVKGEDGESIEGKPGQRGRDAHEIQILPGVDETRSYAAGVCARWRGGLIRAERQTDPIVDGDVVASGWTVYLEGIAEETETIINDGREIERVTTYTSGKSFTRRFKTAMPIDRGVWKEKEGGYLKGDGVSFGGSFFIAQRDTTDKPETSDAFRLAVKRGRNGADGKMIIPRTGPVRLDGSPDGKS